MTTELAAEIAGDDLVAEAQRYLAAVEMFRAEGREPSWAAEPSPAPASPPRRRTRRTVNQRGGAR
jgi:hypothetical protein